MPSVPCSQCGRKLTTPQDLTHARLRCPACGTVFPARAREAGPSAAETPGVSPLGPGAAPALPPFSMSQAVVHQRAAETSGAGPAPGAKAEAVVLRRDAQRRRKRIVMVLAAGMMLAGLAAAGALLGIYGGKARVTVRDAAGNTVTRWMTSREIEEEKRRAAQAPPSVVVRPDGAPASAAPAAGSERTTVRDVAAPSAADPRISLRELTTATQPAAGLPPAGAAAPTKETP